MSRPASAIPPADALAPGTVAALAAMGLGVFVIANDFTSLSVALPTMERDFDVDVPTVQWVINAYALAFGVLIVTGGRLADMLGRRRVFFAGAGIFATFSLLAGAAPGAPTLIAARAAMGVGGALMWPAILGMTYALLPPARAGLAGGLILGVAGLGNAFGPLLGGLLTDALSWRWILFLNLPIAALACTVIARTVAPGERGERQRIDLAGVASLSGGLVALLVGLDQATDWGWTDARVLGLLAAAAVGLAAFGAIERGAGEHALVPRDVMGNRDFAAACLAVLLMSATFFSALLYVPQLLQKLFGWSALGAGAGLLPMMATFAVVSFLAGPLYGRLGARAVISLGALCLPVGLLALSFVGADAIYGELVPGLVVLGAGIGLFYSSITTAAVTALDPARASLAGGIVYMFQVAGGSIGLGLTTTVFAAAVQAHVHADPAARLLTTAQEHAVNGLLAGTDPAHTVVARFPELAQRLEQLARDAFVAGVHAGLRVDAGLAAAGLLVVLLFVGRHAPRDA